MGLSKTAEPEKLVLSLLSMALLLCGPAAGCKQGSAGDPAEPPSVCPTCEPRAGGETSDFGGMPTPCGFVTRVVETDADAAKALGFDVTGLEQRIERDIDAPLRWEARRTEGGVPATGYEQETRVEGSVTVTSYSHGRPDPEFCNGTTCSREGTVDIDQATCPDRLLLAIEVDLHTLDGAIQGTVSGEAVQWRQGAQYEPMIGDAAQELLGHAYGNLRDVKGTLKLFPDEGMPWPAQHPNTPYSGVLVAQLDFTSDETHGFVWPEIWLGIVDERDNDRVDEVVVYRPLEGKWPAE